MDANARPARWREKMTSMSPTTTHVTGRAIRISELAVTSFVIRDQVFEDCLIIGPAVLALTGNSSILNCTFDGDMDAILWELPPDRTVILGAIQMENCVFIRCRFQLIGFAGPKEFADQFRAGTMGSQS